MQLCTNDKKTKLAVIMKELDMHWQHKKYSSIYLRLSIASICTNIMKQHLNSSLSVIIESVMNEVFFGCPSSFSFPFLPF